MTDWAGPPITAFCLVNLDGTVFYLEGFWDIFCLMRGLKPMNHPAMTNPTLWNTSHPAMGAALSKKQETHHQTAVIAYNIQLMDGSSSGDTQGRIYTKIQYYDILCMSNCMVSFLQSQCMMKSLELEILLQPSSFTIITCCQELVDAQPIHSLFQNIEGGAWRKQLTVGRCYNPK